MTVISPSTVNAFRTQKIVTVEPVLNIVPLTQIAAATIITAPTYPMSEVEVNPLSGWSNVTDVTSVGRAFSIEDSSGKILTWGVQRLIATDDTFYVDAKSLGDGGYATGIMREIPVNSILRVYRNRPAWAYLSRATADGGLKYWDVAYFGTGLTPQPVANLGTHQQAFVAAPADEAEFTLDSSGSFDWILGTGGITERLWILPDEATITDGDTDTASITISLPAGVHEVGCKVTSANGQSLFGWRWMFVNVRQFGHQYAAFSDKYPVINISGDVSTTFGRQVAFEISGDLRNVLYPGALCVFTTRYKYAGTEQAEGVTRTFVGYMEELSVSGERNRRRATATFYSPLKMTEKLPTATQLIEEILAPDDWREVSSGLSHPAYCLHYLLIYHVTVLFNHDLEYESFVSQMRRLAYGFGSDVIGTQLKFLQQVATCIIGCRSDGTITMFRQPDLLQLTDKNALDTKYTWTDRDLAGPITVQPELRPALAYIILDGVMWDGNQVRGYRSIAPGYAQMQGVSKSDAPDVIVPQGIAVDGQTYINQVAGQMAAYENNPLKGMQLVAATMVDIWEPADSDWHALDVSEDYLPISPNLFLMNWAEEGFRFRPEKVSRNWSIRDGIWRVKISAVCRALSDGTPGVYLSIDEGGSSDGEDDDGWDDGGGDGDGDTGTGDDDHPGDGDSAQDDTDFDPGEDDFNPGGYTGDDDELYDIENYHFVLARNNIGKLARSTNWLASNCSWELLSGGFTGKVVSACWDHVSTSLLAAFAVTYESSDDKLRVYYCANIKAISPAWSLYLTQDVTSDFVGTTGHVVIKSSAELTALAWLSKDGIRCRRLSSSYVWGSTTTVGSLSFTDDEISLTRIDLDIEPDSNVVYITGMVADQRYKLFKATGASGSFSAIDDMPSLDEQAQAASPLIRRRNDRVYVVANKQEIVTGAATKSTWSATRNYNGTTPLSYVTDSSLPAAKDLTVYYGYDVLLQTDEQRDGFVYDIDSLTFTYKTELWYDSSDGDPPGNAGDPEFFPPNISGDSSRWSVDFLVNVQMLDQEMDVIWASGDVLHNTLGPSPVLTYGPSPSGFNRIKVTVTSDASKTYASPVAGVAYIRVRFKSTQPKKLGTISPEIGLTLPELVIATNSFQATITEARDVGRRLYRVNDSGTPTWTDISPPNASVPAHNRGLGKRGDLLTAITQTPQGIRQLQQSDNDGAAWSNLTNTSYKWVKRYTEAIHIVGGDGKLDMTLNNFSTVYQRRGKWLSQIGQVGDFEDLLTEAEWKAGPGKV